MMNLKNNSLVITVLIALLVGGLGFFAGTKYQETKFITAPQGNDFGRGMMGGNFQGARGANGGTAGGFQGSMRQGSMGNRPVIGDILNKDEKSITVKLTDGSSKIVLFSASTPVTKSTTGATADLTAGTKVAVYGTTNPDGSFTAQSFMLNPTFGVLPSPTPTPTQ